MRPFSGEWAWRLRRAEFVSSEALLNIELHESYALGLREEHVHRVHVYGLRIFGKVIPVARDAAVIYFCYPGVAIVTLLVQHVRPFHLVSNSHWKNRNAG